jgi:hypothetical protein
MKNHIINFVAALIAVFGCSQAQAQFSSGSDGSYGPIDVQANTVLRFLPHLARMRGLRTAVHCLFH